MSDPLELRALLVAVREEPEEMRVVEDRSALLLLEVDAAPPALDAPPEPDAPLEALELVDATDVGAAEAAEEPEEEPPDEEPPPPEFEPPPPPPPPPPLPRVELEKVCPSRPPPLRLPRSCGVSSEENFSADVVPVRSSVSSTVVAATV